MARRRGRRGGRRRSYGRRFRRHRRGGVKVGKWVSLAFKGIGATVAAGPAISAVSVNMSNPGNIPAQLLYNYTGYGSWPGATGWNPAQAGVGFGSIAGGIVLAKLGSFLGKHIR